LRITAERILFSLISIKQKQDMVEARKTKIGPIDCYQKGFEFIKDEYFMYWAIVFVAMLIAGVIPVVLQGPMFCGVALVFLARSRGEPTDFGMIFKGFDYFGQSVIAALLNFLLVMVAIIPAIIIMFIGMGLFVAAGQSENGFLMIPAILCLVAYVLIVFLISMLTYSLLFFACALIVDKNVDGLTAFKLAVSGVLKNVWGILGHSLVGAAMVLIGYLACIIPAFLCIPILLASQYMAYLKIFGDQKGGVPPVAKPMQ
jgi:hypothetical protein